MWFGTSESTRQPSRNLDSTPIPVKTFLPMPESVLGSCGTTVNAVHLREANLGRQHSEWMERAWASRAKNIFQGRSCRVAACAPALVAAQTGLGFFCASRRWINADSADSIPLGELYWGYRHSSCTAGLLTNQQF